MGTNRLEAFSDGVIAIIITIMVLELRPPHEASLHGLVGLGPVALSYVLSFMVVAIMWVNHHRLVRSARRADARLLWANNHLLFWMSLIPFATNFLGENPLEPAAIALYGGVLACGSVSFSLLRGAVARQHAGDADMRQYHGKILRKNWISVGLYLTAVAGAWLSVYFSYFIFILVPALYFLPERGVAEAGRERTAE